MKTGRPKEYKNGVLFTTTMESELLEKFKDLSFRDRRNMNTILQELVVDYIKKHEAGNEQYTLDNPTLCTPAFFRDSVIIHDYFMKCKDSELDDHKYKICEWIHAFKQRYGESPI